MDNLKLGIEYFSTLNLTPNPLSRREGAFLVPKATLSTGEGSFGGEVLRRIMFGHKNF